ncbi:MAG: hypothetical protein NTX79_06870 [Candidatus Micrarchaeota archaeon]|nr:hypothetical protein [Candidatus Micrarchaeota archaeon]
MTISTIRSTLVDFPKNNADAAMRFGPTNQVSRLPLLREVITELTYGDNRKELLKKIQIRPIPTSMVAISSNLPFSRLLESKYVIRKDGEVFVKSDEHSDEMNRDIQPPQLVQIDKRLIVPENMDKRSIIIAENNWVANEQGGKCIFSMLPGNDQRFVDHPKSSNGGDQFELKSIIPYLFNEAELKNEKLVAEFLRNYNTEPVFSLPNSRSIKAQICALFAGDDLGALAQHALTFLMVIGKMKAPSTTKLSAGGIDYSVSKARDGSVAVSRQFFAYMRFEYTNVPDVGLAMTGDGCRGESMQKVTVLPEVGHPVPYGYVLLMEERP